eukprot:12910380-Alexandrium_andersonii.AAC.1
MKTAWTEPSAVMSSTRREMFGGRFVSSRRPESTRVLKTTSSCLWRCEWPRTFSTTVRKRSPTNL